MASKGTHWWVVAWDGKPVPQGLKGVPTPGLLQMDSAQGGRYVLRAHTTAGQRLEQCFGLLQICGVEALGEPAVDRGEQLVGLGVPTLL